MPARLAVLIIHGMGSQRPTYHEGLVAELQQRMVSDVNSVAWRAVYWQEEAEKRQRTYLSKAREEAQLDWYRVREFVATSLGDAAAYQFGGAGSIYVLIHELVREQVRELYADVGEADATPLVVIAHSLGSHIMSNYIWDMQHERGKDKHGVWDGDLSKFEKMETLAGFITFGSNIPLFTFAYENPEPITFPGTGLADKLRPLAKWLNFYDRDDVLGYPLRPIDPKFEAVVHADIEIDAGSWGAGLTPLSHVSYWTDASFTKPVAEYLDSLQPPDTH